MAYSHYEVHGSAVQKCQMWSLGMTAERVMSLAAVEMWREMVKTGGKQATNSRRCMLQQETSDGRWLSDGMVERAAEV